MKTINIYLILVMGLALFFTQSCEKKDEDQENQEASTAPVAAFTANQTSIIVGSSVDFTDQSENSPADWTWEFGDGETSTQENPSHTYNEPGTYTVSLTVTNNGGSDTETKTDYITVKQEESGPLAGFSADQTTITEGSSVKFTDESKNAPTDWSWNFGDGNTSTSQNPSHTYNEPGTYTVSLTVTNNDGSDTETKTDYITVKQSMSSIDYNGTLYVYPEDNVTSIKWGSYGTDITDGNGSDSDTDGEANTSAIVSQIGSDGHAAYVCDTLTAYGYSDWYLPAKSELNALYQNKNAIGGFSSSGYWSSTEPDANFAWGQYFDTGNQYGYAKDSTYRVRCVRRD